MLFGVPTEDGIFADLHARGIATETRRGYEGAAVMTRKLYRWYVLGKFHSGNQQIRLKRRYDWGGGLMGATSRKKTA